MRQVQYASLLPYPDSSTLILVREGRLLRRPNRRIACPQYPPQARSSGSRTTKMSSAHRSDILPRRVEPSQSVISHTPIACNDGWPYCTIFRYIRVAIPRLTFKSRQTTYRARTTGEDREPGTWNVQASDFGPVAGVRVGSEDESGGATCTYIHVHQGYRLCVIFTTNYQVQHGSGEQRWHYA